MNNVNLIGRLTNNPEIRYIGENQVSLVEICIAVNRKFKSKQNISNVDFIDIEIWGKLAENCNQYLEKGSKISVEGSLQVSRYKTSHGDYRVQTKVRADSVGFLERPKTKSNSDSIYYDAKKLFEEEYLENKNRVDITE